jgi:pimeloyl-ACP methyl ester carboxylesterase
MTVREHEPVRLPDGRRLDVCEVGDPDGRVALYLHGTGSSRLEVAPYAEAATRHRIRLEAWNRPGSGDSDVQPGRTLLDVVADTRAVAESVGADRPVVVGLSGGGCHVLALAAAAPDVVRAGVAINPGPPADDAVLAEAPRMYRILIKLARDRPRWFGRITGSLEGEPGPLGRRFQERSLDPLDLAVMRDPVIGPLLTAGSAEGRRQPRAYTEEALMIWGQPWGVSLDSFAVPLVVFAGRHDPFMTFGLRLERAGAELHWFDGGHMSGFAGPVVEDVMARTAAV